MRVGWLFSASTAAAYQLIAGEQQSATATAAVAKRQDATRFQPRFSWVTPDISSRSSGRSLQSILRHRARRDAEKGEATRRTRDRRRKRADTSRLYARRLWKGRSIFSRATENGPAFCGCFVCTQRSASPLDGGRCGRRTLAPGANGGSEQSAGTCTCSSEPQPDWVRHPELKVSTPAHAKHLGWHVEFEFRVTHAASPP